MSDGVPDDVMSDEPVMPEIPIKPNHSIPLTIGILMIFGSLLLISTGLGEIYTHTASRSPVYYEQLATTFSLAGIETNASEVEEWDKAFQAKSYHLIAGITTVLPGIGIGAAGVMFCMKRRLAIKVGLASSGLYVILSIAIQSIWASSIESEVGISMKTSFAVVEFGIMIFCSVLCVALPLIPMMVKAGSAALQPTLGEPESKSSEE